MSDPGISELVKAAQDWGGLFKLEGDRIKVTAPHPLPADLMARLRKRKPDLIVYLQQGKTTPPERRVYRFRTHSNEPWQYMICPPSLTSEEVRSRCLNLLGCLVAFEPLSGRRRHHVCQ